MANDFIPQSVIFSQMTIRKKSASAFVQKKGFSATKAANFLTRMKNPQLKIASVINIANQQEAERNRAIFSRIVENVKFVAAQNITL